MKFPCRLECKIFALQVAKTVEDDDEEEEELEEEVKYDIYSWSDQSECDDEM